RRRAADPSVNFPGRGRGAQIGGQRLSPLRVLQRCDRAVMSIPPIYEKARRFVYWWWIVPRVQYDFEDLDYQLYTFEIFHQDWRAKLAHYVTIPAITFFSLAFLAQFHL